jgi:hypothetical protein
MVEMKNNLIKEILSRITPEEHSKFQRQLEEDRAFQEMIYEQGYRYNTDKSYSIKLLNDAGHFPIGITTMMCEETFIFKLEKEATKAWKSGVLGNDGWFYGKRSFQKALEDYEKDMNKRNEIFWL